MRVHPRRALLLLCCAVIFVCLGIYVYSKNTFLTGKRKRIVNFSFKKLIPIQNTDLIYWSQDSGVRRPKHGASFLDEQGLHDGKNSSLTARGGKNLVNKKDRDHENNHDEDEDEEEQIRKIHFNVNVQASDFIPLNRDVPDSRPDGCDSLSYPHELPTTSVVIPFHNEWPSVLMRTVHSLIDRTPPLLLKKIILVDDASDLKILKTRLSNYVKWTFPEDLVKIIRLHSRQGLIRARLEGFKEVTSETVSFFDSHMEVNKDWLQPLLYEVKKNRKTVAMTQLDYIDSQTLKYNFYEHYRTRYGFKWDMEFFETFFRPDQMQGKSETDPLPGVLMVGPGFVVDTSYFKELGTYDGAMKIWGGENIEFAWRAWLCGGNMLHVPCSRVGHIERSQPYSFPEGRRETEMFNYKRAVDVWMGPYKKYVYEAIPGIQNIDVGNLTSRLKIKERLKCKDFSWFHQNIWPELLTYRDVGKHWGQVQVFQADSCLDNDGYLFQDAVPLALKSCQHNIERQGFALSRDGRLRTTLHCVVIRREGADFLPFIENCFLNNEARWTYKKNLSLVNVNFGLCLQVMSGQKLVLQPCQPNLASQKWIFKQDIWSSQGQ